MKTLIFIGSNVVLLGAIYRVLIYDGKKFIGISLSKCDLILLLFFEIVFLLLCFFDFRQFSSNSVAADFAWNNLIVYYRGVIPLAGIMSIWDFDLENPMLTGLLMLFGAVSFDYVLLRFFTFIKYFNFKLFKRKIQR